jgi:hypothetical protein
VLHEGTADRVPLAWAPMASGTEPGTPQEAATAWVEAVMDRGDLTEAWPITDPVLRLVLAQDWVWNHRHELATPEGVQVQWETIAQGLASSPPQHELWERFASETVGRWQQIWKGFNARTWRVSEQAEVLGLDLEMVTFVEVTEDSEGGDGPPHSARQAFSRRFAMVHSDGVWLVASVNGDQLFRPGWPPRLGQPAG